MRAGGGLCWPRPKVGGERSAASGPLPTGRYDRLGKRPSDGFGSGAFTTMLSFYSQTYFWLPNGRILRMRFDVSQAFSSSAHVEDASVYGTAAGLPGATGSGSALLRAAAMG